MYLSIGEVFVDKRTAKQRLNQVITDRCEKCVYSYWLKSPNQADVSRLRCYYPSMISRNPSGVQYIQSTIVLNDEITMSGKDVPHKSITKYHVAKCKLGGWMRSYL